MILIQQLKLKWPHDERKVREKAAKALMIREEEMLSFEILRRSLDCRKKPEIYYVYAVCISAKSEEKILNRAKKNPKAKEQFSLCSLDKFRFPKEGETTEGIADENRPVIAGAGPAGLFCAYYLALAGMRPVLYERGQAVEQRQRDVDEFWKTGRLNPSSNVQFGEGGAGTFSDGKLNTLVKDKDGRNRAVLETFVKFGAKESILYDAKPHLGTDVLSLIVKNLRKELLRLGAEVHFESQVTDFQIRDGQLKGITINHETKVPCENLVLAVGHSARDTVTRLHELGMPMEAKPFAVGFRVEHPQEMINVSQYGAPAIEGLEAASYKVTAKAENARAVYSFCMCPGGYVVNASSEEGRLAVNGMSYSGRDGKNANSAVIVSVTPEDYPGEGPLSGIQFQRDLEEKAYRAGGGKIPVQRYGEYREAVEGRNKKRCEEVEGGNEEYREAADAITNDALMPSCKGEWKWADLSTILPEELNKAFIDGMHQFGRQIRGFDGDDAILLGVESRTSSPVRMIRDDSLESSIKGIFPCGEGAGYAGGITSAAMDGLRVAQEIDKRIRQKNAAKD